MRLSSSPSEGLLGGLSGVPDVDAELSDRSLLQAMLDAEAALARAAADVGILPAPAAGAIVEQCHAERYGPVALGRAAEAAGNPVVPFVRELTAAVPEHARAWVHLGATSHLVTRAAAEPSFRAALLADTEIRAHLSEAEVDEALDPYRWLGSADWFVDRALASVRGAGT
ncbi:hypothetical protein ABZU25_06905 [Micromonospora sp. NPDC005215]|uniref:hypothetical protein n=1 Tax=Micromonospora sp. NPDC005215 TaxID=3157024 RepID=UPI0033B42DF9